MPRRNRSSRQRKNTRENHHRELKMQSFHSTGCDTKNNQAHIRVIPASRSTKEYICPACHRTIAPGTSHIVAWPAEISHGVEYRRHWHNHCWKAFGQVYL